MNEHHEISPAGLATARRELTGAALVSLAADSAAQQVRPANRPEPFRMVLRGVRESSFELTGGLFLPRNCRVHVEISVDGATSDLDRSVSLCLSGSVKKVSMLDPLPTFAIWIQIDSGQPDLCAELHRAMEG